MDKPHLSFQADLEHELRFLGIQFGWGLQLANMERDRYEARRRPGQDTLAVARRAR
jgi:hypothetical protein